MENMQFHLTAQPDPHIARRKRLRKKYPAIKALYGPNRYSAVLLVLLVCVQFLLAAWVHDKPFWLLFLVSYFIGAYVAASLYALIHDASHTLIFRSQSSNKAIAIVGNLPLVIVGAMPFFRYHLAHHARFNDYRYDVGVPTLWEARWVGNRSMRKLLWLMLFPLFQWLRASKYEAKNHFADGWMVVNILIQISINIGVFYLLGLWGLIYLLLSFSWSFGLHPLGTRVVQEHFVIKPGQETNNYIGAAKLFECNFGLHAEHHDFPTIPWNRLAKLSKIAAEEYNDVPKFKSRWHLLFDFILNPRWSIFQNTVRIVASHEMIKAPTTL